MLHILLSGDIPLSVAGPSVASSPWRRHPQDVQSLGDGTGRSSRPGLFWRGTLRFTLGSPLIHRFAAGPRRTQGFIFSPRAFSPSAFLLGCALLPACTLITDVNREDIPTQQTPVFPVDDAGADASAPDPVPLDPEDAGAPDAGESPGDAGGTDAGDGGAEIVDSGADAG